MANIHRLVPLFQIRSALRRLIKKMQVEGTYYPGSLINNTRIQNYHRSSCITRWCCTVARTRARFKYISNTGAHFLHSSNELTLLWLVRWWSSGGSRHHVILMCCCSPQFVPKNWQQPPPLLSGAVLFVTEAAEIPLKGTWQSGLGFNSCTECSIRSA